jgi:hypothetical protein
MRFLINELSFIGQAQHNDDADNLMKVLLEIIKELERIRGEEPILIHSSFFSCYISKALNVKEWLYAKSKSSLAEDQENNRLLLIKLMNKGPFVDEFLEESIDYHECKFNNQDVFGSSLAGAAYLKGTLISLKNAPEFAGDCVQVTFTTDGEFYEDVQISNLTDVGQANKLRPRYVPSPKHAPPGGWGTLMDLSDEVAQAVLDKGVVSGRQIYGYFEGKFYEFQSDNIYGFHGYPVSQNAVPSKVIKQMQDLGIF